MANKPKPLSKDASLQEKFSDIFGELEAPPATVPPVKAAPTKDTSLLDKFKDVFGEQSNEVQPPMSPDYATEEAALGIIKKHEGFRPDLHEDPGKKGQWNVGYGTIAPKGVTRVTEAEGLELARKKVQELQQGLSSFFGPRWQEFSPEQKAGLLSGAYNMGLQKFTSKDSVKALKAGNVKGFLNEYKKNVRSVEGKVMPGLERRRIEELAAFEEEDLTNP